MKFSGSKTGEVAKATSLYGPGFYQNLFNISNPQFDICPKKTNKKRKKTKRKRGKKKNNNLSTCKILRLASTLNST